MENNILKNIHAVATRNMEIRQAAAASPGMEIGAAYNKWKTARGESAEMLLSADAGSQNREMRDLMQRLQERPCTQTGCGGSQRLEPICAGCIEGQAGYKTKWTCRTCLHRDLSKESLDEWILKLSSS